MAPLHAPELPRSRVRRNGYLAQVRSKLGPPFRELRFLDVEPPAVVSNWTGLFRDVSPAASRTSVCAPNGVEGRAGTCRGALRSGVRTTLPRRVQEPAGTRSEARLWPPAARCRGRFRGSQGAAWALVGARDDALLGAGNRHADRGCGTRLRARVPQKSRAGAGESPVRERKCLINWWLGWDSNPRPRHYESGK